MKFRNKPVIVEATQWFKNGDHPADDCEYFRDPAMPSGIVTGEGKVVRYFRHPVINGYSKCDRCSFEMHLHGWIDTLEDGYIVCVGDWIITGVAGEKYPCKPSIFLRTYERLED